MAVEQIITNLVVQRAEVRRRASHRGAGPRDRDGRAHHRPRRGVRDSPRRASADLRPARLRAANGRRRVGSGPVVGAGAGDCARRQRDACPAGRARVRRSTSCSVRCSRRCPVELPRVPIPLPRFARRAGDRGSGGARLAAPGGPRTPSQSRVTGNQRAGGSFPPAAHGRNDGFVTNVRHQSSSPISRHQSGREDEPVVMRAWLALLLLSLALSLGTALVAFRRRNDTAAARSFVAIPVCHALWTALEIVGLAVRSVDGKLLINGLEWVAGLGMVAASVWFASEYIGRKFRVELVGLGAAGAVSDHPDAHRRALRPSVSPRGMGAADPRARQPGVRLGLGRSLAHHVRLPHVSGRLRAGREPVRAVAAATTRRS